MHTHALLSAALAVRAGWLVWFSSDLGFSLGSMVTGVDFALALLEQYGNLLALAFVLELSTLFLSSLPCPFLFSPLPTGAIAPHPALGSLLWLSRLLVGCTTGILFLGARCVGHFTALVDLLLFEEELSAAEIDCVKWRAELDAQFDSIHQLNRQLQVICRQYNALTLGYLGGDVFPTRGCPTLYAHVLPKTSWIEPSLLAKLCKFSPSFRSPFPFPHESRASEVSFG